jgi:hypothetical protein
MSVNRFATYFGCLLLSCFAPCCQLLHLFALCCHVSCHDSQVKAGEKKSKISLVRPNVPVFVRLNVKCFFDNLKF